MKFIKYCLWTLLCMGNSLFTVETFSIFDGQSTQKSFTSIMRNITKSGMWEMRNGGTYWPSVSGPVMQIKSSGVNLDLHNHALHCGDNNKTIVTAIEVGYSKAELDLDPTLQQVTNVTIKNGCFVNFDVGIIVHEGVNTLTIEDCTFDGVSVGVVFLGTGNQRQRATISAHIKQCTIIGHGLDKQEKLVLLKDKIENNSDNKGYSYGKDALIPLFKDVLDDDKQNVYSYAGIIANYVYGLRIDNVRIQNFGYHDYDKQSEGPTRRTAVFGIRCFTCADVTIDQSYIYSNFSEIQAVGIQLVRIRNVQLKNLDIVYQRSACKSCSIEALDLESLNQSAKDILFTRERTIALNNVRCELNLSRKTDFTPQATEVSIGLCVQGVFSLQADNLVCEGINGEQVSYGLYGNGLLNCLFDRCKFNQSKSNRDLNDKTDGRGIEAVGAYVKNSNGLTFKYCDFSNNIAKNTAIGLCLELSENIDCQDCIFSNNQGITYKQDELAGVTTATSIRAQHDTQEISNYGPVVSATQTGGYGLRVDYCKRLAIKDCEAKNNSGHRACGYSFHNSGVITLEHSSAYYQHSYGDFVHSDLALRQYGGIVPDDYKLPVLEIHKPLLFNSIYSRDFSRNTVDVQQAVYDLLIAYNNIRDTWATGQSVALKDKRLFFKNYLYLFSSLARFRLWGVAYGMHMHNCHGMLVTHSRFGGQIAKKDNAAGLVLTGRCSDFYLENSEMSYNYGWTDSIQEEVSGQVYDSVYDTTTLLSFFKSMFTSYTQVADSSQAGFNITDTTMVIQGQKELDGSGNEVGITKSEMLNTYYNYMNIYAPLSCGLILSDSCNGGTFLNNKFHGNKGFAGYSGGLWLHAAENFLIKSNQIDDNGSNIYGYCVGLVDVNLYSENSFVQNHFSFNRVDGYYNSHALIIEDYRSNESSVYPKVRVNNGNDTAINKEVDNVESLFPTVGKKKKKDSKILD